jgi:hypothetical protein
MNMKKALDLQGLFRCRNQVQKSRRRANLASAGIASAGCAIHALNVPVFGRYGDDGTVEHVGLNRGRDLPPHGFFSLAEMKSSLFWYVQVVFHDAPPLQLGSFKTEEEANDWVTHKSDAWLEAYANGKNGRYCDRR